MKLKSTEPLLPKEKLTYRRPIEEILADFRQPDPSYKRLSFNEEAYWQVCQNPNEAYPKRSMEKHSDYFTPEGQLRCPSCHGGALAKNGKEKTGRRRWKCCDCGRQFSDPRNPFEVDQVA